MPKQKTHRGLAKRVKVTAGGKIARKRAGAGHLMSGKNAKRRRRLSSGAILTGVMARKLRTKLGK
jgi:large subunit ribosomal protein L35